MAADRAPKKRTLIQAIRRSGTIIRVFLAMLALLEISAEVFRAFQGRVVKRQIREKVKTLMNRSADPKATEGECPTSAGEETRVSL